MDSTKIVVIYVSNLYCRYVRAFVMDLCGSVMFVDSSGDAVPIMFLSLLRDIQRPSKWNWGGAVLAHLYRGLCHACLVSLYKYFNFFITNIRVPYLPEVHRMSKI